MASENLHIDINKYYPQQMGLENKTIGLIEHTT
jgi:hypothetical protein